MSKSKNKHFRIEDREYWDGDNDNHRIKEEKMKNKRKERRIEHALRTKNITELLEVEEDWDFE